MNRIYTLANFSTQSFSWNSEENTRRIEEILDADKDFLKMKQRQINLAEDLNDVGERFRKSIEQKSKDPDYTTSLKMIKGKFEDVGMSYATKIQNETTKLTSEADEIWSSNLALDEKNRKIAGKIKNMSYFVTDITDDFIKETKHLKNVVDGTIPKGPLSDLIVVNPPRKVTTMGASKGSGFATKVASSGGGSKGALIAGLTGAGLLAAGLGVGIPLAVKSRKKKKEKKRIDKGRVKSYVRRGKLVKNHTRNYKPDK